MWYFPWNSQRRPNPSFLMNHNRAAPPTYNPIMSASFPSDHSLCESCGYPLKGLPADDHCPECGQSMADSDPAPTRLGLPMQHAFTPRTILNAYIRIATTPRAAFRKLRLDGGLSHERGFLLLNCLFTALLFEAVRQTGWVVLPAAFGLLVFALSPIIISFESLGVWFFSRRRQWRVDFTLAQRIVCLASVGWIPVGPLIAFGVGAYQHGWHRKPWIAQIEPHLPNYVYFLAVFACIFAVLWFEAIVGLGVRQVRYGNRISPGLPPDFPA